MQVPGAGKIHFFDWNNSYIPNILHEIYLQKIYAPFLSGKRDLVLFDLGSNIGLWTLYAAQYAKKVYSFEPAKSTFEIGKKNIEDNGIMNVELVNKAVATEDGELTFYHSQNSTMNSLNEAVNTLPKEKEVVKAVRLDTFVKEKGIEKIDFMKIDVEGVEDKIFSSDSFISIAPIVESFVYEWHSWANANPNTINAGLKELGFTVRQIPSDATIFGAVRSRYG